MCAMHLGPHLELNSRSYSKNYFFLFSPTKIGWHSVTTLNVFGKQPQTGNSDFVYFAATFN